METSSAYHPSYPDPLPVVNLFCTLRASIVLNHCKGRESPRSGSVRPVGLKHKVEPLDLLIRWRIEKDPSPTLVNFLLCLLGHHTRTWSTNSSSSSGQLLFNLQNSLVGLLYTRWRITKTSNKKKRAHKWFDKGYRIPSTKKGNWEILNRKTQEH